MSGGLLVILLAAQPLLASANAVSPSPRPVGACADVSACSVELSGPADCEPMRAAVRKLGLSVRTVTGLPRLKQAGGDSAFTVELDVALGRLRVRSQQRAPEIYGESVATPLPVKAARHATASKAAYAAALTQAMRDLDDQIALRAGVGHRQLVLSVQLSGLSRSARDYVAGPMFSCLKGQLDLLGEVTAPHEVGGYLEDRLQYAPTVDEPRQPFAWHAARLKAALLGGPKASCTILGSPLEGHEVRVQADEVAGGVTIALRR